jgi:hypothetical protein
MTLTSGADTFTFANPVAYARYLLVLKQPAAGGAGTITWPVTVKWAGGTTPTLTTTNGRTDLFMFYWDGTSYAGTYSLNHSM